MVLGEEEVEDVVQTWRVKKEAGPMKPHSTCPGGLQPRPDTTVTSSCGL